MAAIPLAYQAIVEATSLARYQGQEIRTVLHYKWVGPPVTDGTAELVNLNTQLVAAGTGIYDFIIQLQNDLVLYYQTRVQIIRPARQVYLSLPFVATGARPVTSGLPANVNAVVTKRLATVGRGRSGSIHITGLNASDALDGRIQPGALALLQDIADHVADKYSGIPAVPDMWVPISYSVSQPAAPGEVFAGIAEPQSRVMRRRTVGVGI